MAINANEQLIKFKNSIIEKPDAIKSSFSAEVNSFKNKHLNFYANDGSVNSSVRLIRQIQDDTNFLKEQLKNKDEIINLLLQQFSKRDNTVVQCNHLNNRETPDTIQSFVADIHREQNKTHVWHNTPHAEILLGKSINEKKTDDSNLRIDSIAHLLHLQNKTNVSQTEKKINQ